MDTLLLELPTADILHHSKDILRNRDILRNKDIDNTTMLVPGNEEPAMTDYTRARRKMKGKVSIIILQARSVVEEWR